MKLLEKILWADDFSAVSKDVESMAKKISSLFDSTIIPMHVLPDDILDDNLRAHARKKVEEKLEAKVSRLRSEGIDVKDYLINFGSPYEGIVKAAIDTNANIILVGAGNIPKSSKSRLGLTTFRIIQRSEKPVLVIAPGKSLDIKRILCPVDFSSASERALRNAMTISRKFNAQLTVLGVCQADTPHWLYTPKDREEERQLRLKQHEKSFNTFLENFNLDDLDWQKLSTEGKPADEITRIIEEQDTDLLIMGTAGRTGLERYFVGSVTEKVIRDVPTSFLTLKSEDVINLKIDTDITDLDTLYKTAVELSENGYYEEAVMHFKDCLSISSMHIPAYFGIADVYEKLKNKEKAEQYRKRGQEIKERMWYAKVEDEVRKLRHN
jgi:nucleotide-binding universal stress UspA family protein